VWSGVFYGFVFNELFLAKLKFFTSCLVRPRPVSRKTSEDGVKKSFLSEPKASLKDFSRRTQVFRAKRAQP
jgi:hypothetical protein